MGQNCTACLKGTPAGGKNMQDVDLSKKPMGGTLHVIREDEMENIETPLQSDGGDKRYKLYSGNPNMQMSHKAREIEMTLPPLDLSFEGINAYCLEDGSIYTGQFNEKYEKSGKGIEVAKDGAKYIGGFINNMRDGLGRLITAEGSSYEGEFCKGAFHGNGKFCYDKFTYEGRFADNFQHGRGKEIWNDGSYFEGMYEKGLKNGIGKFVWNDGSWYEGEFVNNRLEGRGVYSWVNGKKYEGLWADNKMNGFGIFTWKDGRRYDGNFVNDNKHGKGQFKWPNGKIYSGNWEYGKQHGYGEVTYYDLKKGLLVTKKGIWEKGVRKEWLKD